MPDTVRMILVGAPGGEFRRAAELARDAGADVAMADAPAQALDLLREGGGDMVMVDVEADIAGFIVSLRAERFTIPVLACGIQASAERAVAAIRAGAKDYVPLPPQRELIAAAIASVIERKATVRIGDHPVLARAMSLATAVAPTAAPVLVTGEKGTGKEVMARVIHEASGRANPLHVVECAGVAADVLESELFGHEAGAFPGAVARRIGRLEKAAGGTIFLREVGALAPATQARLFAALQEQCFQRLGGDEIVPFQARLIASTSMDLDGAVAAGAFRADLLVRLGLVRVEVPPLRARGADIAQLAQHFAAQFAIGEGVAVRPFSDAALVLLSRYSWPGNIRELEDFIHRAVLLGQDAAIEPHDLVRSDGTRLLDLELSEPGSLQIESLVGRTVEEVERELILHTLERCHGNRTSASSILGISVRTMRNKLRTFIEAGIAVAPAP
ncbi:sigma-54 dependent transcriptional regulator [Sphingomonas sp. HF-S4]|uniref:Sigma-54 dependent transcriptional regulator n=1 Tax=Sphingomonas agrestis TaxID=3080540 RepID=A0ABU3Y8A2_9SPHN|nr:sigma-54 dependent transcriptional regulator [Sphingomonas sp. HF-S4]MDV3457403.1 sigma-54 dependent transcriptional regulator [Sphingomonas sp. HF-S4]